MGRRVVSIGHSQTPGYQHTRANMNTLIVILIAIGVASAFPHLETKKRSGNVYQTLMAAADDDAKLQELLNSPASDIEKGAKQLDADLVKAIAFVDNMMSKKMFVDTPDGSVKATKAAEAFYKELEGIMNDVDADLSDLPDLHDDTVFLDDCIDEAEKYDYNTATSLANFVNTVLGHVMECGKGGMQAMRKIVDMKDVDTKDKLLSRLGLLEDAAIEFGHMGKYIKEKFEDAEKQGLKHGADYNAFMKNDDKKSVLLNLLRSLLKK